MPHTPPRLPTNWLVTGCSYPAGLQAQDVPIRDRERDSTALLGSNDVEPTAHQFEFLTHLNITPRLDAAIKVLVQDLTHVLASGLDALRCGSRKLADAEDHVVGKPIGVLFEPSRCRKSYCKGVVRSCFLHLVGGLQVLTQGDADLGTD